MKDSDIVDVREKLANEFIDEIAFESRFHNVHDKRNNIHGKELHNFYGTGNIYKRDDMPRRSKHEVFNGIGVLRKIGVDIIAPIYNLPFTVMKSGRPATTAFTDKNLGFRNIYLVPDDTPQRVMDEKKFYNETINELIHVGRISINKGTKWLQALDTLNTGQRVAASILHEQGHILTYNILDKNDIGDPSDLYDWLDDHGYLDNCSSRIPAFRKIDVIRQLNAALEQLAEDYRVSHFVKMEMDTCCLPHATSYIQDIHRPESFFEGVDIMVRLLKIEGTLNKASGRISQPLDDVLPFGEACRSEFLKQFTRGPIEPLTAGDKKKAREALRKRYKNLDC